MIGILVSGHGNFATGLLSSLKLIVGDQEMISGVDFLEEHGTEELRINIKEALKSLGNEILVLTDIAGGSPFKNAVMIKQDLTDIHMEVVSGTNVPMLLDVALRRESMSLDELVEIAKESGVSGISNFKFTEEKEEEIEDGI